MKAIVTDAVHGIGVPITDPFEALRSACAFSSRDWSAEPEDAWIYGIIVGWGKALPDVAARHGWDLSTAERLRRMHRSYHARAYRPKRDTIAAGPTLAARPCPGEPS